MKKGFTLVELSIVLVIIGLLIGGILVGQSLIKSAEQKSVISEMNQIKISWNLFRERFKCVPGDCARGVEFFGFGIHPSQYDGNGLISRTGERFANWRQLQLSGLFPRNAEIADGLYVGTPLLAGSTPSPGENVPIAKAKDGHVWFLESVTTGYSPDENANRNHLRLGYNAPSQLGGYSQTPFVGDFSAEDILSIDQKIDDGMPGKGDVGHRARASSVNRCIDAGTDPDVVGYNLAQGDGCHIYFWLD